MTLSALIKKGGLANAATVTAATNATHKTDQVATVAPVATVSVATNQVPTHALSPDDEEQIRAWLAHIEETDPAIITEILDKCRGNSNAYRYFLQRSEEIPRREVPSWRVRCGDCSHFTRINHPNLGHCTKEQPEAIAGLWDSDQRYCKQYLISPLDT